MASTSESLLLDDRYEVGATLGRGGMGEVRKAHDRRLARDVAIKFLRADLAAQPDVRERFANEAHNAARLTHPNVVLVLDTGEHDGVPYLVMECLPGPTLRDEIKRGPLGEARATEVARDVLAGLSAAHEIGIVHRDISPANILLADDGHAKIADFGIAKSIEGIAVTVTGQVLGTPAYLSPERLHGEPATPAADVYAVGVVLYEALTGERPFHGDTPVAVAQAVMSTTPEPLRARRPDVDPNLSVAVDAAMAKDPASRPPTAAAMLAMLDGVNETVAMGTVAMGTVAMGTVATQTVALPTTAPAVAKTSDSHRGVWISVATAVVVALLVLGLMTHRGSHDNVANQVTTTTLLTPTTSPQPVTTASVVRVVVPPLPKVGPGKEKHGKHGG